VAFPSKTVFGEVTFFDEKDEDRAVRINLSLHGLSLESEESSGFCT
jgi:hypothetical protein